MIVIDELHTYRGVFGSHVANVLRRLLRLCAHYGSNPIIVCSSATIGNPAELAAQLTGRTPRLIDRNGAPAGARHVLLVDPPLLDPATGARGSALTHAAALGAAVPPGGPPDDRVRAGAGRGRDHPDPAARGAPRAPRAAIADPRLPRRLPARPSGARSSAACATARSSASSRRTRSSSASTSAPSTCRSSPATRARSPAPGSSSGGPAGARRSSVGILIASGSPVDQYVIHHPEFLLEGTPEEARIDPDNLHVLLAHLRCATFERPFEPGEVFGPGPVDDLLAFIAEEGHVRQAGDGRWYWSSENFPASEVSLRTAAPGERRDHRHDAGPAAGHRRDGPVLGAGARPHAGDLPARQRRSTTSTSSTGASARRTSGKVDVDYYTYANRAVTLKPLDVFATERRDRRPADPRRGHGREPRDAVQEAQVRHRRERRLGPDRPARAGAPDDRVLAHGRGRVGRLAQGRPRRRAARRRAGRSRPSPRCC